MSTSPSLLTRLSRLVHVTVEPTWARRWCRFLCGVANLTDGLVLVATLGCVTTMLPIIAMSKLLRTQRS